MRPFFNPAINTIYLDMDGVLADFDRFVLEGLGRTFNHQDGPADQEMWDFLAGIPNLYFVLEPTPYAQQLVELARSTGANVEILTAIPRRTSMPTASDDKIKWTQKYLGDDLKVNFGPYSRDKWKHCKKVGDLLIDDRSDNCRDWINLSGGIAIFHEYENYQGTVDAVARLMRDYEQFKRV